MTEQHRRRDEEPAPKDRTPDDASSDERATDPAPPGPPPSETPTTDADFGFDDLVSLPGKRTPTPPPAKPSSGPSSTKPASGPAPTKPMSAPPPTTGKRAPALDSFFTESTPPAEGGGTFADPAAESGKPATPTPQSDVEAEREMETRHADFGGTQSHERDEEAETLPIVPPTVPTDGPLVAGASGTGPTSARSGRRSPLSKANPTARDPIAGSSAASRILHPGASGESQVLAEGQLLADRYELLERLGKGGMGEVWKAKHILLQGTRAIKVIKAAISRDPAFRQRFLQEGQTMMRVKHPGVVEVTDLDETRSNRELFMVMEYLKGRTIYDAVRDKEKPLSRDVRASARILREVADGMQRIHDERIVHKDLKSDNVLLVVGEDGLEHPKVIDFGLAKRLGEKDAQKVEEGATAAQSAGPEGDMRTTLSGTLAYMAPEQFRAEPSSFQSDVYAFGVMAFEVFTDGEFPLPRGSLAHYMQLHKEKGGAVPAVLGKKRPDLDPALAAIFDRCLAVKKEDRPASFTEVAGQLQYWLDTPERLARRKKVLLSAAGIALLLGFSVWSFFFASEQTASLSSLAYSGGGRAHVPHERVIHLPEAALADFTVAADIEGKPGDAAFDVDGRSHPVSATVKDGKFLAKADLSQLADGQHSLALKPSRGAAPTTFVIEVDRVPPQFKGVSVKGAVAGSSGVFSRAQSPEVRVELDEPASRIQEVAATLGGKQTVKAQPDVDGDGWVLKGTSNGDGPVDLELVARDHAGNESRSTFAYVRDTELPSLVVADEFDSQQTVHVRGAAGQRLALGVADFDKEGAANATAVEASVALEGQPPVTKTVKGRGDVTFELPAVPEAGLKARVSVRDAAGNETSRDLLVRVRPDGIVMSDGDMKFAKTLTPTEETTIVALREYALGEFAAQSPVSLTATQVRDARGEPTSGAPRPLTGKVWDLQRERRTLVVGVSARDLQEGSYEVAPAFLREVPVKPYRLTIDGTPPSVEAWTVKEASGRTVPEGGWALSPDIVVTTTVADLSLERLTLGGKPPEEPLAPGRRTYTFRMRADEGTNTWPLVATDSAKNVAERAVTVNADWSAPEILSLDAPRDGETVTDVREVEFVGNCSESTYTLIVDGLPDGTARTANCVDGRFAQAFLLPAAEGPTSIRVMAVDPAGHRSTPKVVTLTVKHVGTDLPAETTWRGGVTTLMEQVEPGDVVVGGRVHPVARVFVDKTEVTNAQYRAFLAAAAGGDDAWRHPQQPKGWSHVPPDVTWKDPQWNADDLPVVNVAYWDAYAFAKWSGDRRLPTEAEWVKAAARCKDEPELRSWPPFAPGEWKEGVLATDAKGPVSALTGADVSPVGCLHMGGNVSEWVEFAGGPGTRGGSWFFSKRAADVRNTPAKAWDRSFREKTIGFRCAVDASRVQP